MTRVNLLTRIPSIYNTVRPNTPTQTEIERRSKHLTIALSGLVVALMVMIGLSVSGLSEPITVKSFEPILALFDSVMAPNGKPVIENRSRTKAPAPVKPEYVEPVAKVAEPKLEPITSRPVAQSAKLVLAQSVHEPALLIRFAICVHRKSCSDVVNDLKTKKISSYVTTGPVPVTAHNMVAGPWLSADSATEAMNDLKKAGTKSSVFSTEGRYFLSTNPVDDISAVKSDLKRAQTLGFHAKQTSKIVPKTFFKVYYKTPFSNKDKADQLLSLLHARGIDCLIEQEDNR